MMGKDLVTTTTTSTRPLTMTATNQTRILMSMKPRTLNTRASRLCSSFMPSHRSRRFAFAVHVQLTCFDALLPTCSHGSHPLTAVTRPWTLTTILSLRKSSWRCVVVLSPLSLSFFPARANTDTPTDTHTDTQTHRHTHTHRDTHTHARTHTSSLRWHCNRMRL